MVSRKQSIFYLFSVIFIGCFALCCRPKKNTDTETELLSLLLMNQPGVQSACEKFFTTENLCVSNGTVPAVGCSSDFISSIRSGIQPSSLRTDQILEKYIRCFDSCNLEFNILSQCPSAKFATNREYRQAERDSGSGNLEAKVAWTNCNNQCRSVNGKTPKPGSGLEDSGTTYPVDWFSGK
jgi:hypothetical protein